MKVIKNKHLFIFDFFGFEKNKEVVYRTRDNLKFFARGGTSDKSEIVIVCSGSEYPPKFFPQTGNDLLIVDIGAHIGTFSNYISRSLEEFSPSVYAIEPALSNFEYLEKNTKSNFPNSIKCYHLAIGARDGLGYIDVEKEYDAFQVRSREEFDKRQNRLEECRVVTLQTFCREQKIDKILRKKK